MHLVCDHEHKCLQNPENIVGSFVDKVTGSYEPSDVSAKNELPGLIQDHFCS